MRGKRDVWLAVYGANPITASGTLINLKFRVVHAPGSSSSLAFSGLMLNEANPAADGKSAKVVVRRWCDNNLMIEKSKFDLMDLADSPWERLGPPRKTRPIMIMSMMPPNHLAIGLLIVGLLQTFSATDVKAQSKADQIRAIERQRLRSLVDADMATASRLHADDFQLINPRGGTLSKEQYLRNVASGNLNYLEWEPGEIRVRLYGNSAVIRYQARLRVSVNRSPGRRVTFWHTDFYEKRNGQWQIVWAHATQLNDETSGTDEGTIRKLDDEKQIGEILKKWEDAWNTHDMSAYASLYHDDGMWVLWTGDVWKGKQAIEEGHAAVHKTIFRNSVQRENLEEVKIITPNTAIVRFCSILTGSDQAPNGVIRSRKLLVLTKRENAWKISWGQNTRLTDTVPDSECFVELRKRPRL